MLDPLEQQKPPGRDRAERVGMWISGVGHTVLVLWAIVGGALFAADDRAPVEITGVTTISNQQFQEMAARSRGAGPVGRADGDAPAQPQTPGDTSAPEGPEIALEAPEPDTTAAALPQPSTTAEPAPDLSDLETARPPVEVATIAPAPQAPVAEVVPDTPRTEAAPDTATPARPDQPVTPRSALALDRSVSPPDRPAGLREAVIAARETARAEAAQAAAAEQERLAAAARAEQDRQAAIAAEAADQAERERAARAAAARAEEERAAAAREEARAEEARAEEARQEAARAEAARAEAERAEEDRRAEAARAEAARREEEARAEEQRQAEERRAEEQRAEEQRAEQERRAEQDRLADIARQIEQEEQRRLAREAEAREMEDIRAAAQAELARQTALAEQLADEQRLQDAAQDAQEATPSPVDGNAPDGEGEGGGSDVLTDALNEAGSTRIEQNELDDALADAMGETRPSELPPREAVEIASVPMTQAEKDGFRDAVQSCWNLGAVSTEALETRVVVGFAMGRDGRPDPDSFRIVGEPETDGPRQQAFEAARRAVMRCAGAGYKLPADKYNEWDDVEMTFTPTGVEGFE